jgi:hypothetical protein
MRRIEWCELLIKLPPLMSAPSTVVLAGLLVSRSHGLKYFAVTTLGAGLVYFVCGLAVNGGHHAA